MNDPTLFTPATECRLRLDDTDFRFLITSPAELRPYPPEEEYRLHTHEFTELFFCASGVVPLLTEIGPVQLCGGEAAVVLPGFTHTMQEPPPGTEWYSACFSGSYRHVRDSGGLYRKLQPFLEGNGIKLVRGVPGLADDMRRLYRPENAVGKLLLFAELLVRMSDGEIRTLASNEESGLRMQIEINRLTKMDELLETHYTEDWNAAKIAAALNTSSRQVDRIAQKRFGMSFRRALMERRCKAAARLLGSTGMTAEQIAAASGFRSVRSMYREFRRQYGMTPIEYRSRPAEPEEK